MLPTVTLSTAMSALPRFALAALLVLPLAACGGGADDVDGEIQDTGEPGVFGRMGELQNAVEQIEEAASRPPAEPVNFRQLRDLLPASLDGVPQTEVEGSTEGAMGFSISQVEARYAAEGGGAFEIQVMDYGAVPSAGMMGLGWTMADVDRETGDGYEKTVTLGGHRGYRQYDAAARDGELSLFVADRFLVTVSGSDVEDDQVEAALRAVDLAALAALRDEGRADV